MLIGIIIYYFFSYRDLDLDFLELLTGSGEPREPREDEDEREEADISEITVDAFIPLTPRKYDPPADFISLLSDVHL